MCFERLLGIAILVWAASASRADETLYRYDGEVSPLDPAAGWADFNRCEDPCSESIENGYFVLQWPHVGDLVNYHLWIAESGEQAPHNLWVEWRFRSNHPFGYIFAGCDARMKIHFAGIHDVLYMYGDAVISSSGGRVWDGLDLTEFRTYRFESLDGVHYDIAIDGNVFQPGVDNQPNGVHYMQFGGSGGCLGAWIPNMMNEWDFVRYGTIDAGEAIIASDPRRGLVSPLRQVYFDRFSVTFDSANYVYVDEIAVETTGGATPAVLKTRRLDNGEPDTVEIVLDRPIPLRGTTRSTFDDGTVENLVEFTFATGDVDADNDTDLRDFRLQSVCITGPNGEPYRPSCTSADLTLDGSINLADVAAIQIMFTGHVP